MPFRNHAARRRSLSNTGGWNGQAENIRKFLASGEEGRVASPVAGRSAELYGVRLLLDSARAVRQNTILIAQDIPESHYDYRATPQTRSIAETLVHNRMAVHVGPNDPRGPKPRFTRGIRFPPRCSRRRPPRRSARARSPRSSSYCAQTANAGHAWVYAQLPQEFLAKQVRLPGGSSVSRFEMLLATKEHELQHRAQLTVLERLLGIVPRVYRPRVRVRPPTPHARFMTRLIANMTRSKSEISSPSCFRPLAVMV